MFTFWKLTWRECPNFYFWLKNTDTASKKIFLKSNSRDRQRSFFIRKKFLENILLFGDIFFFHTVWKQKKNLMRKKKKNKNQFGWLYAGASTWKFHYFYEDSITWKRSNHKSMQPNLKIILWRRLSKDQKKKFCHKFPLRRFFIQKNFLLPNFPEKK